MVYRAEADSSKGRMDAQKVIELETAFAKDRTLPDPNNTTNREFKRVTAVMKSRVKGRIDQPVASAECTKRDRREVFGYTRESPLTTTPHDDHASRRYMTQACASWRFDLVSPWRLDHPSGHTGAVTTGGRDCPTALHDVHITTKRVGTNDLTTMITITHIHTAIAGDPLAGQLAGVSLSLSFFSLLLFSSSPVI